MIYHKEGYKGRRLFENILTLNPVGHQSTNWIVLEVLMAAMAALTSLGTTSPRYRRQTAMYFPAEAMKAI
jgi:hypothetical protein